MHGGAAVMRDGVFACFPLMWASCATARLSQGITMINVCAVVRSSCGDSRVCVTIFVTMSGAEQNLDDSVVHYYGSEALMMSCRAILVVRVCVGVRLTHEKPPAARTARRRRSRH